MERSKNSRSRSVPGSHPHAGRNPTENECGGIHRISQGEKIAEYIQNQLKEDQLTDQMTLKEYMDPLAGNK